ncbi:MAG TPA: hypothetical protein VFM53_07835 [Anaeromyxobacteraceae bacterium]|nr:hypothetical protein [Anaeromyxobacteraceae bacterium]
MVVARLTSALLMGCLASTAWAADRKASFTVSVRVVAPLRKPVTAAPPASFLLRGGAPAVACAAPGCATLAPGASGPAVVTSFPDGTPSSVVER